MIFDSQVSLLSSRVVAKPGSWVFIEQSQQDVLGLVWYFGLEREPDLCLGDELEETALVVVEERGDSEQQFVNQAAELPPVRL